MTPKEYFAQIAKENAERPAIRAAGLEALQRLVPIAQRDSGQSHTTGRFLLGLYNGVAYPFNLVELRGLDTPLFEDCLSVLRLDRRPEREVHEYFKGGDAIWADFRKRWGRQ
ncbi:hypothetical protein SAMN04244579_02140 [Azotobacter beijerinckii]|uniref:DUF7673 domain-containing protein n=1 Tax=Azotobacter beijerinckii TaxID=170623 RepID=A0A1H6TWW7_9GAMM|nr:hypothetical protein [Azotobacter beijerinckii]SEI82714.1 hypothetical protein SAMN04244579_02140 [Azotobacter beijerinckii]